MSCALAERLNTGRGLPLTGSGGRAQAGDPDEALLERVRAGEPRAFDELVRHYQRPVFYLALRYVKNEADAADIAQRTFVRVMRGVARFRGASTLRTWIYRIAINLALNHLRDSKRRRTIDPDDAALTTEPIGLADLVRDERAGRMRAAIEQLPPKQKMVLELRIYDELPFREVGELVGCSENAAKVNFHHAVKRLRSLIAQEAP